MADSGGILWWGRIQFRYLINFNSLQVSSNSWCVTERRVEQGPLGSRHISVIPDRYFLFTCLSGKGKGSESAPNCYIPDISFYEKMLFALRALPEESCA